MKKTKNTVWRIVCWRLKIPYREIGLYKLSKQLEISLWYWNILLVWGRELK